LYVNRFCSHAPENEIAKQLDAGLSTDHIHSTATFAGDTVR